ncbi:MAG: 50S ribosomal protein L21 [Spirochaetes bacterium]|nr:50S ribosomal protein L21 [Spirochaetota bacterium]
MKAIFEDRSKQYTVNVGDVLAIDLMDNVKKDQKLEFNNVLLYTSDKAEYQFGSPYLKGAKVKATVLEEASRDDKVIVFKYKRTKNYKRTKGHRQSYTVIKIEDIKA